ncbi:MAG TPA: S41 family peptidase [Solirubrobacteraceae bacterium]|nr:S41 family peptidase [Solirubrobacteraceae bacterium]
MVYRRARGPRILAGVLLALIVLIVGIWLGGHPSWMPTGLRNTFEGNSNAQLVNDELNLITQNYYRPVDRTKLLNLGMAAMAQSLNDPYSRYYAPSAYRSFLNEDNPHLSGVGIDVVPDPRGLRIVDVFPHSPAAMAGLAHGDLIIRVGSTSLSGRSSAFASRLIRGRAGTRVVLTVVSGGRTRAITVTRADLVVPVSSESIVTYHGIKVGDLRFTAFTDGSGAELRGDVERALHSGAKALILDLRENGGGLLEEAVNVASIFIPDGTIVSTDGRAQPRQVYEAKGDAIPTSIPMVVLVDRDTASSAEIVTAALQDRGRAKVVGTHTYGKGVFQEIMPMPNGGALDLTVGEYFTPNGRNLGGGGVREGAGVTPNVYASDKPTAPGDHALTVAEQVVTAGLR